MIPVFVILAIILGFLLLFYVMVLNISKGIYRSFSSHVSSEYAYSSASEDSLWYGYIKKMNEALDYIMTLNPNEIYIQGLDDIKLHGYFINNNSDTTVVFHHAYSSNGIKEGAVLAKMYYEKGYNVILATQRNHDKSEGDYVTFGVLEKNDCIAWEEYILNNIGPNVIHHGLSMGANAILLASNKLKAKKIIVEAAYNNPKDFILNGFKTNGFFITMVAKMVIKRYKNKAQVDLDISATDVLKETNIPILFIGCKGENTDLVIFESYSGIKERIEIDGALHGSCLYTDYDKCCNAIIDFIDK